MYVYTYIYICTVYNQVFFIAQLSKVCVEDWLKIQTLNMSHEAELKNQKLKNQLFTNLFNKNSPPENTHGTWK